MTKMMTLCKYINRSICCIMDEGSSVFRLPPFLSSRSLRTILSFVILDFNIRPISGKDSSATGLEALHHSPSLILISILVDLLE